MMIDESHSRPWYREPYVWMLIAFPLAAVIAGIITIIIAVKSDDGLVVDDYYKRGLEINRTLERDRTATRYALKGAIQYRKDSGQIRIVLTANRQFPYPEKLNVSILNASRKGMDQQAVFDRMADGAYLTSVPTLHRGKWHILIEGQDWRLLEVLTVP